MIGWVLAGAGALVLWKRSQGGQPLLPTFGQPQTFQPWSVSQSPSDAQSDGSGVTNPITGFFARFSSQFPGPVNQTAPTGAGGATVDPANSGAPSGESTSAKLAASPGTYPEYGDFNPAIFADPKYWYLGLPVDVAVMSEDVSMAMSNTQAFDPTAAFLDASLGSAWAQD